MFEASGSTRRVVREARGAQLSGRLRSLCSSQEVSVALSVSLRVSDSQVTWLLLAFSYVDNVRPVVYRLFSLYTSCKFPKLGQNIALSLPEILSEKDLYSSVMRDCGFCT